MKRWMYIVIAIVAITLALGAVKDNIIKYVVSRSVGQATGLKLEIGSLRVELFKTNVDIKDLRLFNPRGFEDKIMLNMPVIYVDYDLPAIFKGKIHLNDLRIHLKEFLVETNRKGDLNLDSLKMTQEEKPAKKKPKEEAKEKKEGMQLQIDRVNLNVGKVIYKDYSAGGAPTVKEFDLNINEEHKNVTNVAQLVSLIMFKTLAKTTISNLADFELNKLTKGLSGNLLSGTGKLFSSGSNAGSGLVGTLEGIGASLLKKETEQK